MSDQGDQGFVDHGMDGGGSEYVGADPYIPDAGEQSYGDPLEQTVGALAEHVVHQHIETQAAQLVQDFPELAEQENAEALIQTAQAEAQRLGRPDLADDPRFWRQMHLARQGYASLEANRPQTVDEFVDSIIPAKPSSGPLPF